MSEIKNARISKVSIEFEDHGLLTCFVHLDGAGWSCCFGGFRLDTFDKNRERAIGTDWGMTFIMRVMETVGVLRWEDLAGKYVRVKSGCGGSLLEAIGHITEDRWFNPRTDALLVSLESVRSAAESG